MQLRNMSADWSEAGMPLMDEEHMKSKEFKFGDHNVDFPARSAPPSQTQLWLMRATSRALYDDRSPHTKGSLMQEADLGKETVREMRAFVSASACFPYLLRLSSCLDELADISCLWMREYYLEVHLHVYACACVLSMHMHGQHARAWMGAYYLTVQLRVYPATPTPPAGWLTCVALGFLAALQTCAVPNLHVTPGLADRARASCG